MKSLKDVVSEKEWDARCQLAGLYRLIAHFRMTDLIDTHISARLPEQPDQFLINRYGVLFHEMRPQDLVKIDPSGAVTLIGRNEPSFDGTRISDTAESSSSLRNPA